MIQLVAILAGLLIVAVLVIVLLARSSRGHAAEASRLKADYDALATTVKGWNDKASKTADAITTVRKGEADEKQKLIDTPDADLARRANGLFPPRR